MNRVVKHIIPPLIILFYLLISQNTIAQKAIVFDLQTYKPIPNVLIFNKNHFQTALTNIFGNVNLSLFKKSDTLIIQHSSFFKKIITYKEIKKNHFKIGLNERFINLQEVMISANKWKTVKNEIANYIVTIPKKSIVLNMPPTTADMLSDNNQIFVQKSQLGGGSPIIRGFAANRILLIVDGVRLNNAIYRSGNLQNILQVDVNSIQNTEIIFGPGTNIYGSDALGGVIDVQMIKPVLNITPKWKTSGHTYIRAGTAAKERTFHTDINIANNRLGFLSSFSITHFDDLKMGTKGYPELEQLQYVTRIKGKDTIVKNTNPNIQKFSGYTQRNFLQKIRYNFDDKSQLNAGFYFSNTSPVSRYDRLIQISKGKLKYAQWNYSPQSWMMANISLKKFKITRFWDKSLFNISYQLIKEGRNDRKYQSNWLRKRIEKVNVLSFTADFNKKLNHNKWLFYGILINFNNISSSGIKQNIITGELKSTSSRYPDGSSQAFQSGAYISIKKIFENIPLTFIGGIRLSQASLISNFIDTSYYHLPFNKIKLNNNAITGSVGINYHPGTYNIRANFSSGFRAPNLDDVAKIFDSEPGNVVVPNKNLKPEYIYNLGVGIQKNFKKWAEFEINIFYSYLNNAMVRRNFNLNGQDSIYYDGTLSRVQAVVNTGWATIYGFSADIDIQPVPYFGLKGHLTFTKGSDDSGNSLRHIPPIFGATDFYFEKDKLRLLINIEFNGEVSYNQLAPSERNKSYLYVLNKSGLPYSPSWRTYNFKGTYALSNKFLLSFAIENITDYRYRPYSSGISAPGRNFAAGLRYRF